MVYGNHMEKTTVYLPEALQRALKEAARAERKPQAELVRAALEEYLERRERPSLSSLGSGEDEELSGTNSEEWLESQWGRP